MKRKDTEREIYVKAQQSIHFIIAFYVSFVYLQACHKLRKQKLCDILIAVEAS
jgi:hypothetical protein